MKVHKDKGKEEWEIFAWAVRDVMAKYGNLKLATQNNAEKILYRNYMSGKTNTLTIGGKTFSDDHRNTQSVENEN